MSPLLRNDSQRDFANPWRILSDRGNMQSSAQHTRIRKCLRVQGGTVDNAYTMR